MPTVAASERDFAELAPVVSGRLRPAGHALADLVFQLLAAETERGGAAVVQQEPDLDRVCQREWQKPGARSLPAPD